MSETYDKALQGVKKYTDTVDEALLKVLAKNYAIVMTKKDTAAVACSDPAELTTVKNNFLKKKLGMAGDEAAMDAVIKEVCKDMSATRMKSRIVFYYLLTKKLGKESVFV